MAERVRQYVAIDAKSFYASVECVERRLNPLTTHLVVADESRTEKTLSLIHIFAPCLYPKMDCRPPAPPP